MTIWRLGLLAKKTSTLLLKGNKRKPFFKLSILAHSLLFFLHLCLMFCCLFLPLHWMPCPLSSPPLPPSLLLFDRGLMVSVLSLERPLPSAVISCFLGSLLGTHCVRVIACMSGWAVCDIGLHYVCVFWWNCLSQLVTNFPLYTCFLCTVCVICLSASKLKATPSTYPSTNIFAGFNGRRKPLLGCSFCLPRKQMPLKC